MSRWLGWTLNSSISSIKLATSSISPSNISLHHSKFYSHDSPVSKPICWIVWCFCWDIQYSLWYFSIKDNPSSLHLSSQNFIRDPLPIFHFTPSLSHPPSSSKLHTKHKSHQHIDSLWFLLASSKFPHLPYFDSKIFAHKSPAWWNRFKRQLPSNAQLKHARSCTPRPHFFLGRHIVSHFTHTNFFCPSPSPQRNDHCSHTNLPTIFLGTLKKEKEKKNRHWVKDYLYQSHPSPKR